MQARFTIVRGMLLGLLGAACGGGGRAHAPPAPPSAVAPSVLDVSYAPRPAPGGRERAQRVPADDAAHALGVPPLGEAALPEGTREIRMSDWYTMVAGRAVPVLRLVEQPGRPAVGQLLFVWTERREWPTWYRATQCTPWADSARRCVFVAPTSSLDWPAVAARLAALGAWTMTARCEDGGFVSDGGELLVGRLAGAHADAYECNSPPRRAGSDAGRAALALYRYFHSLAARAGGPPPA